ncbi:MAG TPA: hypothetical protein VFE68_05920, partial [Vicinamibacteria bacterium]|nr:hypothetical protein [Vicinamibacteria bacterium]
MRAGRDLTVLAVLVLAALFLPAVAARQARPAVLNLGPNDFDYVRGFREDWERDRLTRFHWTTPHASIRLPLEVSGEGHRLSMRIRRHLIEPSKVTIRTEDRIVSVFDIAADPQVAYRTIVIDLPPLEGRRPFLLTIDSTSADPRPLGIAIDWLQIERVSKDARFELLGATRLALLILAIIAFLAPRLAGASLAAAAAHAAVVAAVMVAGCAWDILAAERIAREGWTVYVAAAGIAVLV